MLLSLGGSGADGCGAGAGVWLSEGESGAGAAVSAGAGAAYTEAMTVVSTAAVTDRARMAARNTRVVFLFIFRSSFRFKICALHYLASFDLIVAKHCEELVKGM